MMVKQDGGIHIQLQKRDREMSDGGCPSSHGGSEGGALLGNI